LGGALPVWRGERVLPNRFVVKRELSKKFANFKQKIERERQRSSKSFQTENKRLKRKKKCFWEENINGLNHISEDWAL
jgi:hypothetical protein